jgi:hypothetical protein
MLCNCNGLIMTEQMCYVFKFMLNKCINSTLYMGSGVGIERQEIQ